MHSNFKVWGKAISFTLFVRQKFNFSEEYIATKITTNACV